MTDDKPRIELNWVQASAASLAAVTSAVLLSTFGVAGTLIGAAVGSLALTLGNAVYSYSINATKHRVATAQSLAAARAGLARAAASERTRAETVPADAPPHPDRGMARAGGGGDPGPAPQSWRSMLAALPWKRIALVSTAVFVAAMLMILVFELVTGRAVSTYTGSDDRRNSIPVWGDGGVTKNEPVPQDANDPEGPESGAPEEEATPPSEGEPTAEPTPPVSPTESADTSPVPSPDPSEPSSDPLQPSPSEPTPSG